MFTEQLKLILLLTSLTWLQFYSEAKEQKKEDVGHVIGIDLGSTYSCVGVFTNGHVEILNNNKGNRVTPSMVAFTNDGEPLVGDAAKSQFITNPENTIYDVKRFLGKQFDDPSVQNDIQNVPYKVINEQNRIYFKVRSNGKEETYSPVQIVAMILNKMKKIAEQYLDKKVNHAVVTVPAYFNEAQRQATKDAGALAELNVGLINESTAAAIAYGLHNNQSLRRSAVTGERDLTQNVVVYHLGGTTFDVSVMKIKEGVQQTLATNGDLHLGGEYFNYKLGDYLIENYRNKTSRDVSKDRKATLRLLREVEQVKRLLSSSFNAKIEVDPFFDGVIYNTTVTRIKFTDLNLKLFRSTLDIMSNTLKSAKLDRNQVDQVILIGGSTRIPMIKRIVTDYFDDRLILQSIQPDEVVAHGAALQAHEMMGKVKN